MHVFTFKSTYGHQSQNRLARGEAIARGVAKASGVAMARDGAISRAMVGAMSRGGDKAGGWYYG